MTDGNIILFILCVALGGLGTRATRALGLRIGFVRLPDSHLSTSTTTAVSYLGGVGMFLGVAGGLAGAWFLREYTVIPAGENPFAAMDARVFWGFLGGGVLFLLLGVVNDKFTVSTDMKFGGQLLFAAGAAALGVRCAFTGFLWIDGAISAMWILVLINAFNLTDVCDGLVTGISVLIFVALMILTGINPLCLAVLGASLGVLWFHKPRATVLLGDGGGYFLGFLVAAITLLLGQGRPIWPWAAQVLLICGIVLFELTLLVLVRVKKGLVWCQTSPDHFSLRLQAAGLSSWETDVIAWIITAVLCSLALVMHAFALPGQIALPAAGALGLFAFGLYILRWDVPTKSKPENA
ncbi:MAG: hypothetical protein JXA11_00395 [Phycisphaerae bacterium]|nr:hypothetical protein [Phycisphaerae bacterium]